MRVLIADDDSQVRRWLLRIMEVQGHEAEAVGDGEELLRRAAAFAPNAVLSDIDMPGQDGIAAGLQLKKNRPDCPVVLMTGNPEQAEAARRAGFSAVLGKPFSLDALAAALTSP